MSKLPDFVKNIIIAIAVPVVVGVAEKTIPREKIAEVFEKAGEAASEALKNAIGPQGETLESLGQELSWLAFNNFNKGLDKDDQEA